MQIGTQNAWYVVLAVGTKCVRRDLSICARSPE